MQHYYSSTAEPDEIQSSISERETYKSVQEILDILAKGGSGSSRQTLNPVQSIPTSHYPVGDGPLNIFDDCYDNSLILDGDSVFSTKVTQQVNSSGSHQMQCVNPNSCLDYSGTEASSISRSKENASLISSIPLLTNNRFIKNFPNCMKRMTAVKPPLSTNSLNASSLGIHRKSLVSPSRFVPGEAVPSDLIDAGKLVVQSVIPSEKISTIYLPNPSTIQQGLQQTFDMTAFQPISDNGPVKFLLKDNQEAASNISGKATGACAIPVNYNFNDKIGLRYADYQVVDTKDTSSPKVAWSDSWLNYDNDLTSTSNHDFQSPIKSTSMERCQVSPSLQQKEKLNKTLGHCWDIIKSQWKQYLKMSDKEMHSYEVRTAKESCCEEVVEMIQDRDRYVWQIVEELGTKQQKNE